MPDGRCHCCEVRPLRQEAIGCLGSMQNDGHIRHTHMPPHALPQGWLAPWRQTCIPNTPPPYTPTCFPIPQGTLPPTPLHTRRCAKYAPPPPAPQHPAPLPPPEDTEYYPPYPKAPTPLYARGQAIPGCMGIHIFFPAAGATVAVIICKSWLKARGVSEASS